MALVLMCLSFEFFSEYSLNLKILNLNKIHFTDMCLFSSGD